MKFMNALMRGDIHPTFSPAASKRTTLAEDCALRPLLRVGETVETIPGVIVSRHSGAGNAV